MKKYLSSVLLLLLWGGLSVLFWVSPRQEISRTERRKLAQCPALTLESVVQGRFMSGFERFVQDQFPLREQLRQANALFRCYGLGQGESNGIYRVGAQAVKLEYPLNEGAVRAAAEKLAAINDACLRSAGKKVFALVPEKGCYLAGPSGRPGLDYDALYTLTEGLDFCRQVRLDDLLSADSYYGSDLHWRQEALLPVAERLCDALGSLPPEGLVPRTLGDFAGVYRGQSALPLDPDPLTILTADWLERCTVTAYGAGESTPVYDMAGFAGRDPYDVFLSGAAGLLTVHNPDGPAGRRLVIFRDSFGSSLAPLLLRGYETVTLVDIRYLAPARLGQLVDFDGQDVLFLYSATVLNTAGIFK